MASGKQRVLLIFGTRPEAIKMMPVAKALAKETSIELKICITAQHREMLDQVLALFPVKPDFDLDVMRPSQELGDVTSTIISCLGPVLDSARPDRVLVHGDTTTTLAASLAAFYKRIPVGHIEAGLRSGSASEPWPEEINRRVADVLADQFFVPTDRARQSLLLENIDPLSIHLTGNTVVDALLESVDYIDHNAELSSSLAAAFSFVDWTRPLLLVTAHRRENFGAPLRELCEAILDLVGRLGVTVVYPVHLNPLVQKTVRSVLSGQSNVHLLQPLDYLPFIYLMKRASLILTDSGGIQEEAPSLHKPVLVMRNVTERPEAVEAGVAKLVGTNRFAIISAVSELLENPRAYEQMSAAHNPYGDGKASSRIADLIAGRHTTEFKA